MLQNLTSEYVQSLSKFSQVVLVMAYAAHILPSKVTYGWSIQRVPESVSEFERIFKGQRLAEAILMFYNAPIENILFLSLHDARLLGSAMRLRLDAWSRSLSGARATRQACRILSAELTVRLESEGQWPTREIRDISDYWVSSFAVMMCCAFGGTFDVFLAPKHIKSRHENSLDSKTRFFPAIEYLISMLKFGHDEDLLGEEATSMKKGARVLVETFDLERLSEIINEIFGVVG